MVIVLDTSSLIRFFTNDIPHRASKVKSLLEKEKPLYIPEVVFPELEYVLSEQYKTPRKEIIEIFRFLASQRTIRLTLYVRNAIIMYEKSKLDMADCIIVSYALKGALASFDRELLDVEGVRPFWNV